MSSPLLRLDAATTLLTTPGSPYGMFGVAGWPTEPVMLVDLRNSNDTDRLVLSRLAFAIRGATPVVVAIVDSRTPIELVHAPDITLSSMDVPRTVVVEDPECEAQRLAIRVQSAPRAAVAAAWLMRASESLDVRSALAMESATYSTLLASSEFDDWLRKRSRRLRAGDGPRVRVVRLGSVLNITMSRPERRNAIDTRMRMELLDALHEAVRDPSLFVVLRGDGPSFCAGGDLDEFGSVDDHASAHLLRVSTSVGAVIHGLRDRISVHVQGACFGAGLELASFAGHVAAEEDATFALPEISMGLIPGAGGTASIARRIGRQRAVWLALSGDAIDPNRAHAWGLVDELL